jgi:inner membrane transporter RhtA
MSEINSANLNLANKVPPHLWFGVSAIFHYLGPSFAVLLFPSVGTLGVAWMRIATAAGCFAAWSNPIKVWQGLDSRSRRLVAALGVCLGAMNCSFYLALERLPMSLVAAIEFVGTIGIALYGLRSGRNLGALLLAVAGVLVLIDVKWSHDPVGLGWAFLNGGMFVGYILLGHRISETGATGGIQQLGAAMAMALLFVMPIGLMQAVRIIDQPSLILAGVGVGICSSVIPYVCDQFAMSRLPRASFAVMLCLLPASAAIIAALVLHQIPTLRDLAGIVLVIVGVAIHKPGS